MKNRNGWNEDSGCLVVDEQCNMQIRSEQDGEDRKKGILEWLELFENNLNLGVIYGFTVFKRTERKEGEEKAVHGALV